jgi:ribA/ribD-fused uncharacterized protein
MSHDADEQTEIQEPITTVRYFAGEYAFLSNFYRCPILLDGIEYPTVEHAYQSAKTTHPNWRHTIRQCSTAVAARVMGHALPKSVFRKEWDTLRLDVMYELVQYKFFAHDDLRSALLSTGDLELIEGNLGRDDFWGIIWPQGVGENHLGKIIMRVREELR